MHVSKVTNHCSSSLTSIAVARVPVMENRRTSRRQGLSSFINFNNFISTVSVPHSHCKHAVAGFVACLCRSRMLSWLLSDSWDSSMIFDLLQADMHAWIIQYYIVHCESNPLTTWRCTCRLCLIIEPFALIEPMLSAVMNPFPTGTEVSSILGHDTVDEHMPLWHAYHAPS